jgi:hypothetical protein
MKKTTQYKIKHFQKQLAALATHQSSYQGKDLLENYYKKQIEKLQNDSSETHGPERPNNVSGTSKN